jgi:hypothetical protein
MVAISELNGPAWRGFISIRSLTFFRSGALSVKGLELVVGKRHLCGELSPESALAILQKTPPDAVWPHDQTHAITSIFEPSAGTNFLERRYLKALENSIGHPWVFKNN